MDTFNYQPLDLDSSAIRLIRLLKGLNSADIECELIYATLDESIIPYEAVSYTWGRSVQEASIKLDGRRFMVTENLWHMLWNVRKFDEDRYLWVDAISINQEDDSERGHQVQRMQAIYREAESVIFYLGPETLSTSTLMESLLLFENYMSGSRWAPDDERWKTTLDKVRPHYCKALLKDTQRRGLEILLQRPWFSRVWVLQEVANARRAVVFCGSSFIRAHIFMMAPTIFEVNLDGYAAPVFKLMPTRPGKIPRETRAGTFRSLLFDFISSEASDPYDKIFALLGLCKEQAVKEWIVPDYTQPISNIIYTTIYFISGKNGTRPLSEAVLLLTKAIPLLPSIEELMKHVKTGKYSPPYTPSSLLQIGGQPEEHPLLRLLPQITSSLSEAAQLQSENKLRSQAVNLLFRTASSLAEIEQYSRPTLEALPKTAIWLLSETRRFLSELRYVPPAWVNLWLNPPERLPFTQTPTTMHEFLFALAHRQDGFMEQLIHDILSTCQAEDLQSFLYQRKTSLRITLDMVEAATLNKSNAKDIMSLLLRHGRLSQQFLYPERDNIYSRLQGNNPGPYPMRSTPDVRSTCVYFSKRLRAITEVSLPDERGLAPIIREDLYSLLFFASQHPLGMGILGIDTAGLEKGGGIQQVLMKFQNLLDQKKQSLQNPQQLGFLNRLTSPPEESPPVLVDDRAHGFEIYKWPLLLMTIARGDVYVLKRLLKMQPGAFETPCESANMAFKLALDSCSEATVRCLLDNGVKIMLTEDNESQWSYDPLSLALLFEQHDIAKLFRPLPLSISAPPFLNTTPLHIAARGAHRRLAQFLVEQGADINATDDLGRTALEVAKQTEMNARIRAPERLLYYQKGLRDPKDCYQYLCEAKDQYESRVSKEPHKESTERANDTSDRVKQWLTAVAETNWEPRDTPSGKPHIRRGAVCLETSFFRGHLMERLGGY